MHKARQFYVTRDCNCQSINRKDAQKKADKMVTVVLGGSITDDVLLSSKFLGVSLCCLYILLRSGMLWAVAVWGCRVSC